MKGPHAPSCNEAQFTYTLKVQIAKKNSEKPVRQVFWLERRVMDGPFQMRRMVILSRHLPLSLWAAGPVWSAAPPSVAVVVKSRPCPFICCHDSRCSPMLRLETPLACRAQPKGKKKHQPWILLGAAHIPFVVVVVVSAVSRHWKSRARAIMAQVLSPHLPFSRCRLREGGSRRKFREQLSLDGPVPKPNKVWELVDLPTTGPSIPSLYPRS